MILSDRKYLSIPLPEDIQKRKMQGDFAKALCLIKAKLSSNIPQALRKRLEIEQEIIATLKNSYPYSLQEALEIVKKDVPQFTMENLEQLVDENAVDWYFIDGKVHLISSFYDNLIKVNHPILEQAFPKDSADFKAKQKNLNDSMALMKQQGGSAYRFRVRESLKVLPEKVQEGKEILVHLPLPTMAAQVRNVKILDHSDFECSIASEDYPSRTISFRKPLEKEDEFFVDYSFEIHAPYVELDPQKASANQPTFYTEEQGEHIRFTPMIQQLYQEIVGDEENPIRKAQKIYDYITQNIKYSFMRPYSSLENIPEYAVVNGKGDCGVQALLFITLCRYGKIPAKWQSGLYLGGETVGSHDWAQFYVEPYGWVFADLSFGGSANRVGNEERRKFYFGNIDPFRMPANTEFEHEFFPPKQFTRYDPTDNQFGEAEYEDGALMQQDYLCERVLLEKEPIEF